MYFQLPKSEISRSSRPEVFLVSGVLKIYSKFTGKHQCQSVISIKLLWNFIEITLRHGCSRVNLLHIFRIPFSKNTSGWLLLNQLTEAQLRRFFNCKKESMIKLLQFFLLFSAISTIIILQLTRSHFWSSSSI